MDMHYAGHQLVLEVERGLTRLIGRPTVDNEKLLPALQYLREEIRKVKEKAR